MVEAFSFEMEIDDNGVTLVRCVGPLNVERAIQERKALIEQGLSAADVTGRPMVVDLRRAEPPQEGWAPPFRRLADFYQEIGERPNRRAYVVKNNSMTDLSIRLFEGITEQSGSRAQEEMLVFEEFDEAYQWAKAALKD